MSDSLRLYIMVAYIVVLFIVIIRLMREIENIRDDKDKKDTKHHGEWLIEDLDNYDTSIVYVCSECGRLERRKHNFCPICGADMRSEEE